MSSASASNPGLSPGRHAPLLDFFRYHGIWAPGIRLFRALAFGPKALIMGAVMALPLVVTLWLLGGHWSSQIQFTKREQEGVATMQAFIPVLQGVLDARNATRATLGGFDGAGHYAAARQGTDQAIAGLRAHLEHSQDPLALKPAVDKLAAAWQATASALNGVDDKGRTVFGPVSAASIELLARIGDDSSLVLDPDLDSFYLVNALVLTVPKTMEDVGQLWGWGTYAAKKGGIGVDNERKWHVWSARVASGVDDAKEYFKRAMAANPALADRLNAKAFDRALALRQQGDAAVFDATAPDADQYFADGKKAVADMAGIYATALPALDGLLQARIDTLHNQQRLAMSLCVLSCLLVVYLFISFRKVLEGGLRQVAFHIDAMRDGDLTTQPRAWGRDEVATLMFTLSQMQGSLRHIVSRVRDASGSIVHASTEVASVSMDLSQRTEEAAANLERSAASMEQIGSTVSQTSDNVNEAAGVAAGNADVATRAAEVIEQVVTTMQGIHGSSVKIKDIIGTIDGIAFQTNILALNAAVEAARAGDQGRGFAVVASEVRSLARRSAVAAQEIKQLISASVERVHLGTSTVQTAGETIKQMVSNAGEINRLLSQISTAAREQSKGVDSIGNSVSELDRMTQQNAALVEQTAAAAAALQDQARGLSAVVGDFKLVAAGA